MSDCTQLTLRSAPTALLEVECVAPDRLAGLDEAEIARLPVWIGADAATLGDFFVVTGGRSARVRIAGDLARVEGLGSGMSGGELTIDGSAGGRVGAAMRGGSVTVLGDVGDDAGVGMAGGVIRVGGRAGARLGGASAGASRGMTGGEIVVGGDAGDDAGARMRRGLVVVAGDAGARAARDIIAGTVVVLGRAGPGAAAGGKRGSLVSGGGAEVPATYAYACTYRPPHVRLTFTYLRRHYGLVVDERFVVGRYARYCGDLAYVGKGEMLLWATP